MTGLEIEKLEGLILMIKMMHWWRVINEINTECMLELINNMDQYEGWRDLIQQWSWQGITYRHTGRLGMHIRIGI